MYATAKHLNSAAKCSTGKRNGQFKGNRNPTQIG